MIRKCTLLFFSLAFLITARAGFTPVTLSGFNKDVVANGVGNARSSTTSSVDDTRDTSGYAFLSNDYRLTSTSAAPTYSLPANGLISSVNTSGVLFQLASYSANNSLRLATQNASGILTFATPVTNVSDLYVLATSGGGAATITYVVKFTDSTSQTFTGISAPDWYDNTGFAIRGFGRVALADGVPDVGGTTLNPRLYEAKLTLLAANFGKQIAYISATKTNTAGIAHIMAVTASTVDPCGPPTTQPSNLVLTPTIYGITGSFTPSVPPANKYMVIRTTGNAPTSDPPADGTVYNVGDIIGSGVVISVSASTTFFDPGLTIGSTYTYLVLGYSDSTCVGITPAYNIVAPIFNSATIPPCSPTPGGTLTVGPTGNYPTLSAAMTALNNAAGASGNIIVELQATYTGAGETFPIVVPNISTSPCAVGNPTLTIRPAAGATNLVISGSNATAILDFNNTQRATLDGRPGGVGTNGQLTIINTNTAGVAIRLYNDASNNTITYCDVQGQNTSATSSALSGVIYIGQAHTTRLRGNDYNTISFSKIHGTSTGTPAMGIVSYGTNSRIAAYNDSSTIANNTIYDFFSASVATSGVKLDIGNNAWNITNNSLYQTATRTYTTSNTHRGLWITPNSASIDSTAGAFLITNNFIGGTAANAGSTAYTMNGSVTSIFNGIDISVGNGTASSVQNNVVSNISFTTTSTSSTGAFAGISTANGNINIGTLAGNLIGSRTATGSITVVAGSLGTVFGIKSGGGSNINIQGNTVSGITAGSATISNSLNGIGVTAGTTVNIASNMVGSTTLANSLQLLGSTTTSSQALNGISITGGTSVSVTTDTIMNLTNAYTGSSTTSSTRGINVTASSAFISGNVISNLSNTATASTGTNSAVVGIAMGSTNTAGSNITGNKISYLTSTTTSTTAAVNITGIYYAGTASTTNAINKNIIHSFEANAVDTNFVFTGIDYASAAATVSNNYIRLGIKADGTPFTTAATIRGISANSSTTFNNVFYNTIYIGGTGVGSSTKPSYAFIRTATSGTYDVRNNIFANVRSNTGTGGKHYAVYFTGSNSGLALNNNIYQYSGTGGLLAFNGSADVAAYSSGWIAGDANSAAGNPGFVNATGNAASFDLHINAATPSIAESAGSPVAFFVSDDFDGQSRSTTLPDAGADEFNGTNPNLCSGTPVSGTVNVDITPVCIGTTFTLSVSGASGNPGITYQWQSSTDSTSWTDIPGATSSTLSTSQTVKTFYRIIVKCANGNATATTAGFAMNMFNPTYAIYNGTLLTESFENWSSTCSTNDIPTISWRNTPSTGNSSWRRNDQGSTAGWTSDFGTYSPVSTVGSYSARFHTYNALAGTQGTLDYYVNMAAAGSSTNLKFDYINTSGNDSLVVLVSTNGGQTFTRMDSVRTRSAWSTKTINLTTNSATTVIRFQGYAVAQFGTDIGLDNVQLVNFAQCNGTPNAGAVFASASSVCSGASFTLYDTSASQLASVTYQWQSAPSCTGPWTNIAGATALSYTTSQTAATYYRLVVTCGNGGATAQTACYQVGLNAPTACYCTPTYSSGGAGDNMPNITLGTLTQATSGNVTPYYYDYTTTQNAIPNLSRTSNYNLVITMGTDPNQYNGVWIDFNQNGSFETTEFFSSNTNAGANGTATVVITVPATAVLGQTRMRVRGGDDSQPTSSQACGASNSSWGQAQDFLVNITDVVTPVTLVEFKGEKRTGANLLSWTTATELNNAGFELERSADGVNFSKLGYVASKAVGGNSNAALSYTFSDTKAFTGNNYYRLKQIDRDGKVSYSQVVLLKGDRVAALTLSVVYPNPVFEKLNVVIASPKADKLTLIVTDITGKIVQQQTVSAVAGDNKYQVNVQMLTSGNYIIKAVCNEGCETVISKFTKQ